ncbi:MAG: nucleoside deaminase [Silvibacterium sp.]|jgi:guanine deaminase
MPTDPNPAFMHRAIELAIENVRSSSGGPFAAVIVRDGAIIGEGANSVTTTNDPTAHGEINAIRQACQALGTFSLEGCEIYTSCEPCPMCLAAIYWARIDAIYFSGEADDAARAGFDDSFFYEELRAHRDIRTVPARRVLPERAWESFQVWIETPEKTEY